MEIWKPIKGYEGKYEVSNLGRIKSYMQKSSGQIINGSPDGKGYLCIRLYYKPQKHKTYKIHRLVAESFIPNPDHLPQINHKDENKQNNNVDNLEWCDNFYNNHYGTRNIRAAMSNRCCPTTSKRIYSIDNNGNKVYYDSIGEAERQLGTYHSNIVSALKHNGRNTCKGLKWFYCTV